MLPQLLFKQRCRWAPVLALVAVLPVARSQSVNAYGYDSGGRYHTDNYGSSRSLNLNTNIDVSEAKARLARSFEGLNTPKPQPWYESSNRSIPTAPSAPAKSGEQRYYDDLVAKANAGSIKAMVEIAHQYLWWRHDNAAAVTWLQKGANAGDLDCLGLLYTLLIDEKGGVRDLARAAALLPKLAPHNPEMKDLWGQAVIEGQYFPKDLVRGRALREEAAEDSLRLHARGNLLTLGYDYELGERGMPKDSAKAIDCYYRGTGDGYVHEPIDYLSRYMVLLLSQPDCVRQYRKHLAFLIDASIRYPAPERLQVLKTLIMGTIAPGEPIPEDARTVAGLYYLDPRCGPPEYDRAQDQFNRTPEPLAQRQLGLLYESDHLGAPDYSKAADAFEKAGDAISRRELGVLYLQGKGREKDRAKARALFKQAAADDTTGQAFYYMANDLAQEYGTLERSRPPDAQARMAALREEAQASARESAQRGDPRGQSLYAQWLLLQSKSPAVSDEEKKALYMQARELWISADAHGAADAAFYLAILERADPNGPRNEKKAWEYMRRSSDAGYPPAQEIIAGAMSDGTNGFSADPAAAEKLLRLNANQYPRAANSLAVLIYLGPDGAARGGEAREWLEKAFAAGYWLAGRNLAKFAHLGVGGPKDEAQARAYLEKAAQLGGKAGAQLAAEAYVKGEVIDPDAEAAARWKTVAGSM